MHHCDYKLSVYGHISRDTDTTCIVVSIFYDSVYSYMVSYSIHMVSIIDVIRP